MNYTAAISVVDTYNFDQDSDQGSEKFRYGSESRQKRKLVQENLKICYKKNHACIKFLIKKSIKGSKKVHIFQKNPTCLK